MAVITLLTDFGSKDAYVGIMKGVILGINPHIQIVDISHEVEPQDIREAAFLIEEYHSFFEEGTVHLCVVDPYVGSQRRPIIVERNGSFFVGPDNGIFSLIMSESVKVFLIENPSFFCKDVSSTFHGRDVFAPVAAHLSLGRKLSEFGKEICDPIVIDAFFPLIRASVLEGVVVRFDRFGNAITNIKYERLKELVRNGKFSLRIKNLSFDSLKRSYFEDEIVCLVGSSGYIEFGVFKGSFKERFDVKKGDKVIVEWSGSNPDRETQ